MRILIALWCAVAMSLPGSAGAQDDAPQTNCPQPEARQFDFWVGEWTVTSNGKPAGDNRISNLHGGCTLFEEYTAARGGYEGKSFNYYEPTDGKWHQVWVDNGGLRLHLAGGLTDGSMILSGSRKAGEQTVVDRITWTPNDDGTVRQLWESSTDDGGTWTVAFDGLYTRK